MKKVKEETKEVCDCTQELKTLLMQKASGIFDREPAPSFNGNLDKLVEDIKKIIC